MHYFFLGLHSFRSIFCSPISPITSRLKLAFAVAAIVSLVLVVTYVARVANWKFALREVGISQFLFLVLFSYAFF